MLNTKTLRDAFTRRRYGGGEYEPDFDLFDAAADEIDKLRHTLAVVRCFIQECDHEPAVNEIDHALGGIGEL